VGRIVICGTGTEVGKTHVGAALCAAIRRRGGVVRGLKPIESGWQGPAGSDAARLAEASGTACREPLFALARPVSPHLAAREEGRTIELSKLDGWLAEHPSPLPESGEWLVVETAGGLMTPLAPKLDNLDLVMALGKAELVLVASDRLGALHEVGVCLLAFRTRQVERVTVVLSAPNVSDSSTGSNAAELEELGIASTVVSFPRDSSVAPATQAAGADLAKRLGCFT